MKKSFIILAFIGMTAVLFSACDKKLEPQPEPEPQPQDSTVTPEPQDTTVIPELSFPRKHLIEEFTGQACGYCPYGMSCIQKFMENDTNFILILHHYGYQPDNFSVDGSKTITSALNVTGAPGMAVNRASTTYNNRQKAIVFHPGYLTTVSKTQFAASTYASIDIENSYDASARTLTVNVAGIIGKQDYPQLALTVLVKESGMVDYQADYYDTFEGWEEFRHANAVRAFLTEAQGDAVEVDSARHFAAEYTLTLDQNWNAENCMVVAFLSENFRPVVQAAQEPVVAGTQGGADILHGGIKAVEVPDYYPEPNATDGPATYSGRLAEELTSVSAFYEQYPSQNVTLWYIQAYNTSAQFNLEGTACVPFTLIQVLVPYSATPVLPVGTFPFRVSSDANCAVAGYRDDDFPQTIGGSMFYFTSLSYLNQGYLVPSAQWLIADGEMEITSEGFTVTGHARNGAEIHLVGAALRNGGPASSPARIHARVP